MTDEEIDHRFSTALAELHAVTQQVTTDDAPAVFDETNLEVFWREWPEIRRWAETLWQDLNADLAVPAKPVKDPDLDETGIGG